MAVQLNPPYYDGLTAQQTVSRLLQSLSDGHNDLQWPQQQYWSAIGSQAWYRVQILRQADTVLAFASTGAYLLCLPIVFLLYFLHFIPFLYKLILRRPPPTPLIQCDFTHRTLFLHQETGTTQTLNIGRTSCIVYKEEPAAMMSCRFAGIIFYDQEAHAHLLFEAETSIPFHKSSPEFLADCERLAHTIAAKLNVRCYTEKV